jgi:hypothetical protein
MGVLVTGTVPALTRESPFIFSHSTAAHTPALSTHGQAALVTLAKARLTASKSNRRTLPTRTATGITPRVAQRRTVGADTPNFLARTGAATRRLSWPDFISLFIFIY